MGLFSEGLTNGGSFALQSELGFTTKTSLNTKKTATPNSPWDSIREGLLSEEYLRLRFGGLFSGELINLGGGGLLPELYGTFQVEHIT